MFLKKEKLLHKVLCSFFMVPCGAMKYIEWGPMHVQHIFTILLKIVKLEVQHFSCQLNRLNSFLNLFYVKMNDVLLV